MVLMGRKIIIEVTLEWLRATDDSFIKKIRENISRCSPDDKKNISCMHFSGECGKMSRGINFRHSRRELSLGNILLGAKKQSRRARVGEIINNPDCEHAYNTGLYEIPARGGELIPAKQKWAYIEGHGKRGRDYYKEERRNAGIVRKRCSQTGRITRRRKFQGTPPHTRTMSILMATLENAAQEAMSLERELLTS